MIITYEYKGRVTDIEFDALITSSDNTSSEATTHPVETGSPINDHIRKLPDRFSVEAKVSDTPLVVPTTQTGGATGGSKALELSYDVINRFPLGITTRSTKKAGVNVLQFDSQMYRVRDVYKELKLIQDNGLTVSVRTTYRGGIVDYDNMAILGLTIPRDANSGSARSFNFEMQSMRIVDTKQVAAPKAKSQRKKKGEKGKKEVKKEEQPKLESLLSGGIGFLKTLL